MIKRERPCRKWVRNGAVMVMVLVLSGMLWCAESARRCDSVRAGNEGLSAAPGESRRETRRAQPVKLTPYSVKKCVIDTI